MSDELRALQQVARCLDQAGVAYMVSGSMAMNYYAQPRLTRDIDIVIELEPAQVRQLVSLMQDDFFIDEDMALTAAQTQGFFNIIQSELVVKIDFIVRKNTPYRREEFQRRRAVTVDGGALWLVSPEDLLLSKLIWAKDSESELQLGDVRNLIASVANLDWPYINHWVDKLGITYLLDKIRS